MLGHGVENMRCVERPARNSDKVSRNCGNASGVGGRRYIGTQTATDRPGTGGTVVNSERRREILAVRETPRAGGARRDVVWVALQQVMAARVARTGRAVLDVVDAGGGTGGFAVPLAALGHRVTVVDPSPDLLAAAQRRAAETDTMISVVQGDAAGLDAVVGEDSADLVICHNVLEYVDSPPAALAAIATVLRAEATVSVLAANAVAAVLHRALAGHFADARSLLAQAADAGAGPVPRLFTLSRLLALVAESGLVAADAHGVRIFADLVSGALVDADPGAARELNALEEAAATHSALREVAAALHVLATR